MYDRTGFGSATWGCEAIYSLRFTPLYVLLGHYDDPPTLDNWVLAKAKKQMAAVTHSKNVVTKRRAYRQKVAL